MKLYVVYIIVDLRLVNIEMDNIDEFGNCVVYINRVIEVYCYDYEKFGCCFCLIIVYKECKIVLLLDEIVENDLENFLKSFIWEIKKIRDIIIFVVLVIEKNIVELI